MLAAVIPLAGVLILGYPAVTLTPAPAPVTLTCSVGGSCATGTTSGTGTGYHSPGAGDTVPPTSLMPHSLFNQDVTSWPVARDSATIVAEFNRDWKANYGSVGVNGRPVVWVPAGQPMVPLSVQHGCNNFLNNTGASAPIPSWAPTSGPSDDILTVYQPSSDSVWELWQAHKLTTPGSGGDASGRAAAAGWSACWAGKATLSTFTGVFPSPFGETATGISNLATEVTQGDVLSGAIRHAIGIQVVDCDRFVYPADRGDCNRDPGTPAEGQWFRFAPSVNCADYNATQFESEVCVAGKQKGFVVVDHGGADGIEADYASNVWLAEGNNGAPGRWYTNRQGGGDFGYSTAPLEEAMESQLGKTGSEEQEYQVIANLPWDQLQVVVPAHS